MAFFCDDCPEAVLAAVREIVQRELDKVQGIRALVQSISSALAEVVAIAQDAVDIALTTIPTIPAIDFLDIPRYLTCPLTPLALALAPEDFLQLDPRVQIQRVRNLFRSLISAYRRQFELALEAADSSGVIRLVRRFATEFYRITLSPDTMALAIVISATVLATCGTEEYEEGPYADFANAITDFRLVGGLPADLDVNVAAVLQRLLSAEAKFAAMTAVVG